MFALQVFLFLWHPLALADAVGKHDANQETPNDFAYDVIDTFINNGKEGVLLAVHANSKYNASRLQSAFFLPVTDNKFELRVLINNRTSTQLEYLLFVLLNYKQHPFLLNENYGNSVKILINSKHQNIYNIITKNISKSRQENVDFMLIAIRKKQPNNSRVLVDNGVLYHRSNLIYEGGTFPELDDAIFLKDVDVRASQNKSRIVITGRSDSTQSITQALPEDGVLKLNVNINSDKFLKPSQQMLLVFSGENQVMKYSSLQIDNTPLVFSIQPSTQITIPLDIPGNNIGKDLWCLLVPSPYLNMEPIRGEFSKEPKSINVSNIVKIVGEI